MSSRTGARSRPAGDADERRAGAPGEHRSPAHGAKPSGGRRRDVRGGRRGTWNGSWSSTRSSGGVPPRRAAPDRRQARTPRPVARPRRTVPQERPIRRRCHNGAPADRPVRAPTLPLPGLQRGRRHAPRPRSPTSTHGPVLWPAGRGLPGLDISSPTPQADDRRESWPSGRVLDSPRADDQERPQCAELFNQGRCNNDRPRVAEQEPAGNPVVSDMSYSQHLSAWPGVRRGSSSRVIIFR